MFTWLVAFFGLTILAAMFAFGGIAAAGVAGVGKILFIVGILLFSGSALALAWRGRTLSLATG